ncbi:hypothetical protein [Adhaeribacter pallidiroseus]|uniref:Uncharacterized protein n=1 Tax=Adhaeribacter pallidiroseus TaxID=2072847 RepID=A0A369QJA0_9BACT|nr:hypothetical protein [Adhaeribacter pallidiroseus]RDC63306.1 hypothetical protein AHMF7616_01908 [Adhaeribacter pallidiroseus]
MTPKEIQAELITVRGHIKSLTDSIAELEREKKKYPKDYHFKMRREIEDSISRLNERLEKQEKRLEFLLERTQMSLF